MGLKTGAKSLLTFLAESVSSAERDGTITSILTLKMTNGLKRKIERSLTSIILMEINGL